MEEGKPLTSVGELAVDRVDDCSEEDSIDETDVEEGGWVILVDTSIDHVGDADGGWDGSEGLEGDASWGKRRYCMSECGKVGISPEETGWKAYCRDQGR